MSYLNHFIRKIIGKPVQKTRLNLKNFTPMMYSIEVVSKKPNTPLGGVVFPVTSLCLAHIWFII